MSEKGTKPGDGNGGLRCNDGLGLAPTLEFRWNEIQGPFLFGRPQARCIPGTDVAHVLQQKWTSVYLGVPDEWRDIPAIKEP